MFQSQVTSITPDGEFDSAYGHLYAFQVAFADGQVGQVNSKTNPPPYGVGSVVGYDITGSRNGIDKLKVSARPAPGTIFAQRVPSVAAAPIPPFPANPRPSPAPAAPQQPPKPLPAPAPHQGLLNGATVGMAVKLAGDILMHNARADAKPVDLPNLARDLKAIAECVIDASHAIETGKELTPDDF
jgi:hypothetical protein